MINNFEIFDRKTIAQHFNNYFVNVGPNLATKIPRSNRKFESFLSGYYPTLNETPLTVEELNNVFASLKSNKSPGFDDISPVIKVVYDALIRLSPYSKNI